jgi:hypothetical protein
MPVQPDFSIEARIPTEVELRKGAVPGWSDLTLDVIQDSSDSPNKVRVHLTRIAGEAVCEAIREVLHPWAGKSIIEHIWDELDDTMDGLMDGSGAGAEPKGIALGLATALALMYNPLDPNVDAVREEAMERWDLRHGDAEEMVGAEVREGADDDDPVWE